MRTSLRTVNTMFKTIRSSSLKWVILTLFLISFMYIVYQWFASKAETFRCDGTTMNRGLLLDTSVSAPKQQPSPGSPFSTSVDVMKAWLVSIYPDLGQYADKLVELGYRQPEDILKLDANKRTQLTTDADISHDVHKQLFIEGTDTHGTPLNVPSSAYTTLHKANAACTNVKTSTSGSYQTCVTADEDEANNDSSCTYIPIRVGDMVWARHEDMQWAEARVVAVFNKGQLPTVPNASNDTNHWLQHSKTFFNLSNNGFEIADIGYTPFLNTKQNRTKTSSIHMICKKSSTTR